MVPVTRYGHYLETKTKRERVVLPLPAASPLSGGSWMSIHSRAVYLPARSVRPGDRLPLSQVRIVSVGWTVSGEVLLITTSGSRIPLPADLLVWVCREQ
jgi:hypothetical protein